MEKKVLKAYEPVEMEIIVFESEDVITASDEGNGDIYLPWTD